MSTLVGASLALLVGVMASWTGLGRERSFYPTVTMVVASYYVLFAVMGGAGAPLLIECAVMGGFVFLAVAGFKHTQWLVAAALAGHGVLDFVHPHLVSNPGVPPWWPDFCLAYDVVAASYLAASLTYRVVSAAWQRKRTAASSSGRERASGSSVRHPASSTPGRTSIPTT